MPRVGPPALRQVPLTQIARHGELLVVGDADVVGEVRSAGLAWQGGRSVPAAFQNLLDRVEAGLNVLENVIPLGIGGRDRLVAVAKPIAVLVEEDFPVGQPRLAFISDSATVQIVVSRTADFAHV